MSDDHEKHTAQIENLQQLRDYVLETRRTSVIEIGDKDDRIKSIIKCQEALRAIDEAMAEEKKLGASASYGMFLRNL